MLIVGINAFHGDASAAAVVDGRLVAAVEEERFSRIKHTAGFPTEALRYVVKAAGAEPRDVRIVAVARDPWARVFRKMWHAIKMPHAAAGRLRVQGRFAAIAAAVAEALESDTTRIQVHRVEHHIAHLASSFLVSPFDEAALLSIDGLGDFASAMWGVGRGNRIEPMGVVTFPHSLGIFYTALTQYLGFPKYGDEYKVMGLASYGEPEYQNEFRQILVASDEREMSFELDTKYFVHHRDGADMTWRSGEPHIGTLYSAYMTERLGPARQAADSLEQRHRNIASSLQARLEEVVLDRLRTLHRMTGMRNVCVAGGVAFNCVVNGRIPAETGFEEVYIQPAAGDAGLAIGAAMYTWHRITSQPREFIMEHAYWGPEFVAGEIRQTVDDRSRELNESGCQIRTIESDDQLCTLTAEAIAQGDVVGWFQGRMEWGPRALGNRSILADPRRPEMREILNAKIKRRELFRPFAPSILENAAGTYFEYARPSPFMLMASKVRPAKSAAIPATTHVDGSGRVQTVNERQNPLYFRLLTEFERQTGVPVLLNTSFNENEPVVCTPAEALDCFIRTKMDLLVLGRLVISRRRD